jgi:hypothetical protein
MRLFFDYRTTGQSILDYQGDEFRRPEDAIEFAETIAQDLKNSLSASWTGWWIEVRNAEGMKLFSVDVDAIEQRAA